jgi:hypothetical protein
MIGNTMTQTTKENRSNEQLAVRFAYDANSFLEAANSLTQDSSLGPRYFLFCHSIELLLKSFILASGGDQKELHQLGHKLKDSLARAAQLGFAPADPSLVTLVDWLDPYHRNHDFRYAQTGYKVLPAQLDLSASIMRTHDQIEPIARAAYVKANPQGGI